MTLMLAAALMMPGMIAPAHAAPVRYEMADPFLFDADPGTPSVIDGKSLALTFTMRFVQGDDSYFIEVSTMRRSGDHADAWLLHAYVEPQTEPGGIHYDAVWYSIRFDCVARTFQQRAAALVDADGTRHHAANRGDAPEPLRLGHPDYYSDPVYYAASIACGEWDWRKGGNPYPSAAAAIAEARKPLPDGFLPASLRPTPPPPQQ
ncbi:hypothetical protein OF829_00870 [Sphingomonas sp. LB-2]|uniref:surface-adhesin E family protein n=1 Tax=Sphingomonas caeni TaxID=2984949 RepID=UPI00222F46B9|nr:surface-adhesin E family protein [Sphingomonas caeni]MCW3845773.1 hypothetical protein [Sphingomonas caeni]